jgi:hypothetical protein
MASHNICRPSHHRPLLAHRLAGHLCSGASRALALLLGLLVWGGATQAEQTDRAASAKTMAAAIGAAPTPEESRMWMTVGERRFGITLNQSPAARALLAQLPLTLHMEDLNSNEKHAQLPKALPTQATPAGSIRSGDFMLYGSTTLVVFYASLNSSYAYTRLGRIDDPDALREALGKGAVSLTFAKK